MSRAQEVNERLSTHEKFDIGVKEKGDTLYLKVNHQYNDRLNYKALSNLLVERIRRYTTNKTNEIMITIMDIKKHQSMRVFDMIRHMRSKLRKEWKNGDFGMEQKYMPDYVLIDMQREGFWRE